MALRRHHYERAFEAFLRARRIPYVAVDEAKRALLPNAASADRSPANLKSFDFVIYGESGSNLLVDVKGRQIGSFSGARSTRMESWVTREDVDALLAWEGLFGPGFTSVFVFVYGCADQPPDALFQEVFEHQATWYALRSVPVSEYRAAMKTRSERWGTVDLPRPAFERLSQPFGPPPPVRSGASSPGTSTGRWGSSDPRLQPDPGPAVPVLVPLDV